MARLVASINDTIQKGGSFLIPVFALGRMQEILSIIHDARRFRRLVECPILGSGLGLDLVDYFDEICRKTKHVQFHRSIVKDLHIRPLPRKLNPGEDPGQNALYVVSSGMMVEKTPSYVLASGLAGHARNTIGFVGYCDPDTPGGKLLQAKTGDSFLFDAVHVKTKLKARVERFELSGHADREELVDFAVQCNPRAIVLTHGDPPARAWMGKTLAGKLPQSKILDPVPLQPYQV
jgi:Cft2 family RNA processing exonuclease